ncbi:hypothetical protein Sjap_002227 [Stephania japonica]|uniref:Purple acid phosphatase n=1 Tax=Stephania japonica TaxID=461633 RepID=A0AAP0PSG7_9MAGN
MDETSLSKMQVHDQLSNFTAISKFRLINRLALIQCPDPNPYLSINISSSPSLSNEENVTVTVGGVLKPEKGDWVAMISPSHSNVDYCPGSSILYKQTGDFADLPLLCHYPVKAQFLSSDPAYLGCQKKECKKHNGKGDCLITTCSASLNFHVINIRTDIGFVFFGGGFDLPCIYTKTSTLNFSNPKTPLYGHISSIDSTATSMKLTWVSGDNGTQEVQYGDSRSQTSEVTTFTQDDMCKWDYFLHLITPVASHVSYMTAIGNHEDSGSVYATPDSGGECGVAYETYFPMPTSAKDNPWYSIEQASVHFTIISTEHDWSESSEQYGWMKKDLESVNRSATPWVIFMGPMYSSTGGILPNVDKEFVAAVEPLLINNKVDLALWGHVHNYERTCAVYQNECKALPTKDANGIDTYNNSNYSAPVHAVIGMAGFKLDPSPKSADAWSLIRISEYGYARVQATREDINTIWTVRNSFSRFPRSLLASSSISQRNLSFASLRHGIRAMKAHAVIVPRSPPEYL